ncbi:uncharacterized protein LOC120193957 [Hibiscus syriacus]|uniref:uncharacterized protein LOC120193957 n=1 Tax=Hibiscus syriacus TaxID=106335 RepID=UPI001923347C|nr:uncharacterized protein LOC120193957 [Hibiscus syriacus]
MDPRCCLLAQTERCFGQKPFCSFVLDSGAFLRALALRLMGALKAKCKSLFRSRGCFGCFTKPSLITGVEDPSQREPDQKASFSDDSWNSSACEMEYSGVLSLSANNNASNLDPSGSTTQLSDFINHGLLLWNQTRQQWRGNKKTENRVLPREPTTNSNTIYESLHGDYKPFPHPIPLSEMVDLLVEIWEQEGL